MREPAGHWWEQRWFVALIVLASAIPLVWPDIPPLVDLPGHMGRYAVQLRIGDDAALQNFYQFDWALIGNLGIDLLVIPLSQVFGLELAVKLIVLAIPPMTVAGLLWTAREVHGRVPPTALFAVPLAYNYPFIFGFANFALSMAFALLAFAFWLRLARLGRLRLRAILFLPISTLLWVTHTFGWGALGVMAFSAELVRQYDSGRTLIQSALRAGIQCLSLAPPIALMLAWRSGQVGGATGDWFNWGAKLAWVQMALRDRWKAFDIASLLLIFTLLPVAARSRQLEFSRNLAASAIFLLLVYVTLPRVVFGSAYADMRLAPYMLAIAVIAIRFKDGVKVERAGKLIALAGLIFLAGRLTGNSLSFWLYDRDYDRQLAALSVVPQGARMVSFVGHSCPMPWAMTRLEHLPGLAVVRRNAFSNDQWAMAGAQLLSVKHASETRFASDPSQLVTLEQCPYERWMPIGIALRNLPRHAFDYVWLINPPPYDRALTQGLKPLWRDGTSILYRVVDRTPPAAPAERGS